MDFPQRVNGWALYAHPCFQETYDALVAEVETLKGKFLSTEIPDFFGISA